MIFKSIYPSVALQEYISLYRIRHFIIPPNFGTTPKPYPPHPEQCFIFYPRGAEFTCFSGEDLKTFRPRSVLAGQFTKRIDRRSVFSELMIILVVFKPGALHRLTGIPSKLLTNNAIDLEDVFPKVKEVNARLSSCEKYDEMIAIIETFLLGLTASPKMISRRSDKIFECMMNNGSHSLDWLAREACLSSRQFERKSYEYLGVSPKFFHRIVRFNQSYYLSMQNSKTDWLDLSLYCGYHDYQHLVKDYKEFTGATPKYFLNEESKSLERFLGLNS